MRNQAICQAFLGMKDRIEGLTIKDVVLCFESWDIVPVIKNDIVIGAVFIKENEIHISVSKEYRKRWFTRKLWNETINKIIKKYGEVKTLAMKDAIESQKFIERCGFKKVGEINNCFIYTMKEIRYE